MIGVTMLKSSVFLHSFISALISWRMPLPPIFILLVFLFRFFSCFLRFRLLFLSVSRRLFCIFGFSFLFFFLVLVVWLEFVTQVLSLLRRLSAYFFVMYLHSVWFVHSIHILHLLHASCIIGRLLLQFGHSSLFSWPSFSFSLSFPTCCAISLKGTIWWDRLYISFVSCDVLIPLVAYAFSSHINSFRFPISVAFVFSLF